MVDVPNEDHTSVTPTKFIYYAAKLGFAMDMGFLVYIGPAFANTHLRAGIDATFVSFSFNPIKSDSLPSDHSKSNYWYYYIGQKFGPVLSICPIDRLVIDLSYKMNAYAAYNQHKKGTEFKSDYGKNLTQNEISMNIRYSIILFSFQYNFGKTGFNNFSSDNPMVYVDNNTFRILVGFKF
jgi:hypothetical protein